jgi:hypothetical protein
MCVGSRGLHPTRRQQEAARDSVVVEITNSGWLPKIPFRISIGWLTLPNYKKILMTRKNLSPVGQDSPLLRTSTTVYSTTASRQGMPDLLDRGYSPFINSKTS